MIRLEVIDFIDPTGQALVARVPEMGTAAIQTGAQLLVQQNQEAVFFRDGRAMDRFGPGRYTLSTANIPILTKILTIPWEKSPFQACVYYVGMQRFINQRWGTRSPITMKDPDFGIVRLRGFGKYSFRVVDSSLLIGEIVGTQGRLSTHEVSDYLRDVVVSQLSDLLSSSGVGLLQMASKFDELAAAARVTIGEQFKKFGLELTDFVINNVSPPPEVQKAIDARSSMAAIGDLRSYTLYQAANGLGSTSGGGASAVTQMAAGAGIGMMLPPLLQQAMNQQVGNTSPGGVSPPVVAAQAVPAARPATGGLDFSQLSASEDGPGKVQQLIRQLASGAGWQIDASKDEWVVTVQVGPLRKQHVHVAFDRADEGGHLVVAIWSPCGSVDASKALMLLNYNTQLIHGAFAVQSQGDSQQLVLRANLLADTADSLEITRTLTSIAWQADRLEEQLYGGDNG